MASKLVSDLTERGLVREVGRSETESGRPSDLLALNPQAGFALGLDIKANYQRIIVVDFCGEVVSSFTEENKAPSDLNVAVGWFEEMIYRAIASTNIHVDEVLGIGIGFGYQAIVNPGTGIVFSWTETPELAANWKDFPVRDALLKRLPFPHISVDDIMRSLGAAEAQFGHSQGRNEDFVFAMADAGIGLALIYNGSPYVGPLQIAGEIGHTPLANVKIRCNCGNVGCLETVASTTAILDRIREYISASSIRSVLRENETGLTIQHVIDAADRGDKLAYQMLMEAGEYFGFGLAIAVNMLGPRLIVVGGALAKSEVYLDAARRSVRLQVLSKASTVVRIEPTQMDELAGARGAAAQVLNTLFQPNDLDILELRKPR
jgi:N-acetylglucosamine repressor